MERLQLENLASAKTAIEQSDATHNGTMQRLFGIDWRDATLYALTLNTARLPVADCIEQLAAFQTRRHLRRRSIRDSFSKTK